jgi:hypothetical protein
MIETTLGALIEAQPALERLAAARLSVKTAYHIAKLIRLATPELQQFQTQRNALVQTFGAERPATAAERAANQGQPTTLEVTPENRPAFFAQVAELVSIPTTLAWTPLAIEALDGVEITAADLLALGPFLTWDGDTPKEQSNAQRQSGQREPQHRGRAQRRGSAGD